MEKESTLDLFGLEEPKPRFMVPVNSSQGVDWAAQKNPNQMDP
jgi:hypothetical protein